MQHQMYSVKDKAAEAFLQPYFTQSEATALRALRAAVRDPKHEFVLNKKDYSLYYIGQFDDHTGVLAQASEPVFVCTMETIISSNDPLNMPEA